MRILFDTNVLVRAHAKAAGPAFEALRRAARGHIVLVSPALLDEVERVLNYPRVRTAGP